MIVETFTPQEIAQAVQADYRAIMEKCVPHMHKLHREFRKRKYSLTYPFAFATPLTLKYNGNTYVLVFGSPDNNDFNFGFQMYLVLQTSYGKRYVRILNTGVAQVITKHFMDRFIERSQYPVTADNFLIYLTKDINMFTPVHSENDTMYFNTHSGIVITDLHHLLTYINGSDISKYKKTIREGITEHVNNMDKVQLKHAHMAAQRTMLTTK